MKHLNQAPLLTVAACLLAAGPAFSQNKERDEGYSPRTYTLEEARKKLPPEVQDAMERAMRQSIDRTPWVDAPAADATWRIGVMTAPIDPALRIHIGIPKETGVMVREVVKDSAAAKAGLAPTDIILAAGDRRIGNLESLKDAVQQAGKTRKPLNLSVIHEGKRREIRIEPDGPKPTPQTANERPSIRRTPSPTFPTPTPQTANERPRPDAVAPMMERQNQRFEEMNNQLKRVRAQLERQQQQIEELRKQMSGSAKPSSPPERDRPRDRRE